MIGIMAYPPPNVNSPILKNDRKSSKNLFMVIVFLKKRLTNIVRDNGRPRYLAKRQNVPSGSDLPLRSSK